jgi:hypothetical protein
MATCPIAYPDEIWKPESLLGVEGLFVSSYGRVWREPIAFMGIGPKRTRMQNKPATLFKPQADRNGYLSVLIRRTRGKPHRVLVSRMVCAAFHGPPPTARHTAAHWDNNCQNNREGNLRWATQAENIADKVRHGTEQKGERHGGAKLVESQVLEIRRAVDLGQETKVAIAKRYGVDRSTVYLIGARKNWQHI